MTRSETAQLLARIQAFDRRTVGEADVIAWHVALHDLQLGDTIHAVVAHFRTSTDWCLPAHIREQHRLATARARPSIAEQERRDAARIARIDREVNAREAPQPRRSLLPASVHTLDARRTTGRAERLARRAEALAELAARRPPQEATEGIAPEPVEEVAQ